MRYSQELKDAVLKRILPPNNESIAKVAREEGLPEQTIRVWRDKARANGNAVPARDNAETWSTQDKFLIVVETASMNANGGVAKEAAKLNRELKDSEKERKKLEKELARKEKALAETAALFVLSKKANAIWGDPEDGQ